MAQGQYDLFQNNTPAYYEKHFGVKYILYDVENNFIRCSLRNDERGPGESTALIAYRITTEAFTNLNTGYAASIAVVLFFVMAMLSGLSMSASKRVDY